MRRSEPSIHADRQFMVAGPTPLQALRACPSASDAAGMQSDWLCACKDAKKDAEKEADEDQVQMNPTWHSVLIRGSFHCIYNHRDL